MNLPEHKVNKSTYSDECHWTVVSQEASEERRLLKNAYECEIFAQYKIEHMGIFNAFYPYEIMRVEQSGTFFLACTKGNGKVKINGNWLTIKAGEACIFPPYITNSFKAIKGEEWEFAWVRYTETEERRTVANTLSPKLDTYRSEALRESIEGLIQEITNDDPSHHVLASWVNLIHHQVKKFAVSQQIDPRLMFILQEVANDLSKDWTLKEIADLATISEEHLRRLCNIQFGRSPMQQLTFLRLSHAKNLIIQTEESIESIAHTVGYKSQFSFSNTFKKWIGCRPSAFRSNP